MPATAAGQAFETIARQVPYFPALAAGSVVLLVGEALLLTIALIHLGQIASARQTSAEGAFAAPQRAAGPPAATSGFLVAAAAMGPVLLAALIAASVEAARSRLWQAFAETDPATKIDLVRACFEGQLNAMALGPFALAPGLVLAVGATCVLVAARGRAADLRSATAPAANDGGMESARRSPLEPSVLQGLVVASSFVGLGLGPLLIALHRHHLAIIKMWAGVAGLDTALKTMMIEQGLREARVDILVPGVRQAAVGLAIAFGLSVVLTIVRRIARRRRETEDDGGAVTGARKRQNQNWWTTSACLGAALLLFAGGRSLRAENEAPWPNPPMGAALNLAAATAVPAIEGLDPLDPVPFVMGVFADHVELEGDPVDDTELERRLRILRSNYLLMHPGEPPDERLVVVCPADLDPGRLAGPLSSAARAQYRRPVFAVGRAEQVVRPVLGAVLRRRWRGVEALFADMDSEEPSTPEVLVPLTGYPSCVALVEAAARLRRQAIWPRLTVGDGKR